MKSFVLALLTAAALSAHAQISIDNKQLGTGAPAPVITVGESQALHVSDGYYHIPQYLPSYPSAGTIWVRVVEVQCDMVAGEMKCDGFHWAPSQGRAEYLMLLPKLREVPTKTECCSVPEAKTIIMLKEVPAKPKAE